MNLFFDIETARKYKSIEDAPEVYQKAWHRASLSRWPKFGSISTYKRYASLYPEFSRIVCISVKSEGGQIHSFKYEKEGDLIRSFLRLIENLKAAQDIVLVGHNIKRFDIPFINIRCAANVIKLSEIFRIYDYKHPYEDFIDTLDIWKGENKSTSQISSLEAICLVLGVESPKNGIVGGDVPELYHSGDHDALDRICRYCEADVVALERCFNAMSQLNMC